MPVSSDNRVVAAFEDRIHTERVRDQLVRAGVAREAMSIDEDSARRALLEAEMAEEAHHTLAGPGIPPVTKEAARGAALATVVCCAVALVIALPFTFVGFGGLEWWWRLCILAAAALAAGGTVGFIAGGGILARSGPADRAAGARGVVLAVRSSDPAVIDVIRRADPIRVDVVSPYGAPMRTVATEADRDERSVVQGVKDDLTKSPDDPSQWAAG
jgi:hypothetical protein